MEIFQVRIPLWGIFREPFSSCNVSVTVNVIKLVIMHSPRLLCIISSPTGKSEEKRKFYQIFRLFGVIFMLNGEFEYQIDYLSQ